MAFPTMEDPLGDSMDVASPYPGHADDFEIDIDIMEDQASNADNDFDVRDASPEAMPQPEDLVATNDADMDDVAEPSATNTFDNAESHNQNNSTVYSSHVTYESEMLDEDYEEDIDAPIPDSEALAVEAGKTLEPSEDLSRKQNLEEQPGPSRDENQNSVEPVVDEHEQHVDVEEHEPNAANEGINQDDAERVPEGVHENEHYHQYDETPSHRDDTNSTAHVESQQAPTLSNTEAQTPDQPEGGEPDDGGEPDEAGLAHDVGEEHEEHDQYPQAEHDPEGEDQHPETTQHERYLHPVKVLYQDSEISLFPPREGDSSETFFLEDEGLAYENLDHLLAACRQILGEHVSEDEVLVLDIESLGLQLSEVSIVVPLRVPWLTKYRIICTFPR